MPSISCITLMDCWRVLSDLEYFRDIPIRRQYSHQDQFVFSDLVIQIVAINREAS